MLVCWRSLSARASCSWLCLLPLPFLGTPFHDSNKANILPQVGFLLLSRLVFVACCPNLLLRKLGSAMGLAKVFFFPFGKELGSDGSLFGKGFSCGSPFGKGLLEAGLAAGDGSGPKILGRPWLPTETSLVLTFSFLVGLWSSLGSSASTRGEGSSLWTRGKAETSCRPGFFSISSTTSWTWKNSSGKLAGTSPEVTWEQLLPHVASSSTSPFIKGITLTRALGLQARVLEIDSYRPMLNKSPLCELMALYTRPVSSWGLVVCLAPPLVDIDPFWQGFWNTSSGNVLLSRIQTWKSWSKNCRLKISRFCKTETNRKHQVSNQQVSKKTDVPKNIAKLNKNSDFENQPKGVHVCWPGSIPDAQGFSTLQNAFKVRIGGCVPADRIMGKIWKTQLRKNAW